MNSWKSSLLIVNLLIVGIIAFAGTGNILPDIFTNPVTSQNSTEDNSIAQDPSSDCLSFIENVGQVANDEIRFYGPMPGGKIGLASNAMLFNLQNGESFVSFTFVGSNHVTPKGFHQSNQDLSFFLGDRGTFLDVQGYDSVVYMDLWPGIDLVFQNTPNGIKYEYHVSPGANPSQIKIKLNGHDSISIKDTSIEVKTGDTILYDDGLVVSQGEDTVSATFRMTSTETYCYEIDSYDASRPLTIDPLIYSTFLGSSSEDDCEEVAVDNLGSVYVLGHTEGT
ncbi:MAG: DUF7948 domain-containing protein, partial [Candidatus Thorarchaeota archaeon]